jgi:hypothetical protein
VSNLFGRTGTRHHKPQYFAMENLRWTFFNFDIVAADQDTKRPLKCQSSFVFLPHGVPRTYLEWISENNPALFEKSFHDIFVLFS